MKRTLMLMLMLMLAACDDSPEPDSDADADSDADSDADTDADADADADTDGDPDANSDADAEADADPEAPPPCEPPELVVAGTVETDLLAGAPGRCGQTLPAWLDDPALGEVTAVGEEREISEAIIEVLIAAEGMELPQEPAYDVGVRLISYTTQDRGELIEATALVAYPTSAEEGEGPFDVLAILHGTSGFTDACAPSLVAEAGLLIAALASPGYVVVAPDYIGLRAQGEPTGFLHPYLVGQATAIASLDAVRAAARLPAENRGGVCASDQLVAIGGSQGGHAALWVDRLAPYYAREIHLAGVVATVPPSDMIGHIELSLATLVEATGNTVAFFAAAAPWYGYGDDLAEVFLAPYDTVVPEAMATTCDFSDLMPEVTSPSEIFQSQLVEAAAEGRIAEVDPWGCLLAENGLTTTSVARLTPDAPSYAILFVLGEADTLVDPAVERSSFEELCDQGLPLQFLECAGAGHTDATTWAIPEILEFAQARLDGEPVADADLCALAPAVVCRGTPAGGE